MIGVHILQVSDCVTNAIKLDSICKNRSIIVINLLREAGGRPLLGLIPPEWFSFDPNTDKLSQAK